MNFSQLYWFVTLLNWPVSSNMCSAHTFLWVKCGIDVSKLDRLQSELHNSRTHLRSSGQSFTRGLSDSKCLRTRDHQCQISSIAPLGLNQGLFNWKASVLPPFSLSDNQQGPPSVAKEDRFNFDSSPVTKSNGRLRMSIETFTWVVCLFLKPRRQF